METHIVSSLNRRLQEYDTLILPFSKNRAPLFDIEQISDFPALKKAYQLMDSVGSFEGNIEELSLQYIDLSYEKKVLFLGLGDISNVQKLCESAREAYAKAIHFLLQENKNKKISFVVPCYCDEEKKSVSEFEERRVHRAVFEGIGFGAYRFQKYMSTPLDGIKELCCITLKEQIAKEEAHSTSIMLDSAKIVRDLVNSSAHEINPVSLAQQAELLLSIPGMDVQSYDLSWIRSQKMGLLEAVGIGAEHESRFVIIDWKGNEKERTVFVGKGVTFDSGGLNMKPTGAIETMRADMAGAATLIGLMHAIATLKLPIWITAVLPLAENAVDAKSMRSGDVYKSRKGTTVEIANTDAEGRLILADALNYVVTELSASRIIDIATLTGASEIALGSEIGALFSNSDSLTSALEDASTKSGEALWPLPLYKKYSSGLKSDYADMKNVTGTRVGGAINGALFLEHFVDNIPWAHLDIAGPSYFKDGRGIYGKGASSMPLRTLLEFCYSLSKISR